MHNCTATITLTHQDDKKLQAEVCFKHYGHKIELQHLILSTQQRQEIAGKIRQGVTEDHIMNDVRESVTESFQRQHLIEKKIWLISKEPMD